MSEPTVPILLVLEDVIDCTLFGSGGLFAVPKDGYLNVTWLTKRECYRVTFDVVIYPPERRETPEGIGARRVIQYEGGFR